MIRVDVENASTHLAAWLARVAQGEVVVTCRDDVPVAEIHPVAQPARRRRYGTARGLIHVPGSFFDPLPDDILAAFEGRDEPDELH